MNVSVLLHACLPTRRLFRLSHIVLLSGFLLVWHGITECSLTVRCLLGTPFCVRIVRQDPKQSGIATVFCHGYEASHTQYKQYLENYNRRLSIDLLPGTIVSFDFADSGKNPLRVNRACCCMAQQKEIDRVHAAIMYTHSLVGIEKIVVFGVSRGASAVLGALGQYSKEYPKVIGAVLESPFASFSDVITNIKEKTGLHFSDWFTHSLIHLLCARDWDPEGSHPLDFADTIASHIPIQFIASNSDHLVPMWSTQKLVTATQQNDAVIHFDCIPLGRHAKMVLNDDTASLYSAALQKFYEEAIGIPQLQIQPQDIAEHCPLG